MTFGTRMDCDTAGGEEQNQTASLHSDARPADVPAVKCVPFSPLPAAPVLLCNTEDYSYNDRS